MLPIPLSPSQCRKQAKVPAPLSKLKNLLRTSLLILFCMPLLQNCTRAPLARVDSLALPLFTDDMDLENLLTASLRHLHYLNTQPQEETIILGKDTYTVGWLRESMETFIDIIRQEPTPDELDRIVKENYTVYQAAGRQDCPSGEMLITGYYEPFLQGSLTRYPPFLFPLYTPPPDLVRIDGENNTTSYKRRDKTGQLLDYWSREEIEKNNLAKGHELVYLADPVDNFILHVQGSGKIQLRDGSIRSVHYAASNGLEYFSIGKLLVDQNKMSLEEASIPAIRNYLQEHPKEQEQILHHNKKFIFFQWEQDGPPLGSLGEPLTPGRSIAIDPLTLPHAALAFLVSSRPHFDESPEPVSWSTLHRFVFPQDSGSAIQGAGRADLFWGAGEYAKRAAGSMKEKGTLYFLVKNNFETSEPATLP